MNKDRQNIRLDAFDSSLVKSTSEHFVMQETIGEGYAKVDLYVQNFCVLFEKVDKHPLEYLKHKNCPDFVLFENRSGCWIPHIFEFKRTINTKHFEHSKKQFLGGLQNTLAFAGVLGISLSLGDTVLYSVYRNDNLSDVSNPAKIRCQMHNRDTNEQKKNEKIIKQEWINGCVNIAFDGDATFELKKIKLDAKSGETEYTL